MLIILEFIPFPHEVLLCTIVGILLLWTLELRLVSIIPSFSSPSSSKLMTEYLLDIFAADGVVGRVLNYPRKNLRIPLTSLNNLKF